MFNMGAWDWGIILAIVLVLFGGKRLPELAKGIGKSISSFKQGMNDVQAEISKKIEDRNS